MSDTKRASMEEIEEMHRDGALHHNRQAKAGEDLGDEFWDEAVIETPKTRPTVALRIEEDVLEFFKGENPKGYTSRMAAVLKAYKEAQQRK